VAEAEATLSKKVLVAPFKAMAGLRNVHPGQYLSEGQAMVGLQSVDEDIFLDFAIPQEHLDKVRVGAVFESKTSVTATGELPITVVAIDAAANYDTRNIRVRSVVPNADGRLRPGMFVDVQVPIAQHTPFPSIPMTAVRRAAYGDHVFVIEPGEAGLKATQRFVKLGPTQESDVLVLDGLKPGERVAGAGSFKLFDGSTVIEGGAPAGGPPGAPSTASAK
jgi:membrane fusion protein (multidrug efflux system)